MNFHLPQRMDKLPLMPTIDQSPSLVVATVEDGSRKPQAANEEQIDWRRTVLFGALAVGLLPWVAIYNGYPTVTPDSGSYLRAGAFHVALFPFRAPGYSVFTRWTSLGITAWFTIATQAIIVVYILRETFEHLIGSDRKYVDRCLLSGVLVLAGLTSLPWLVSELMPDVFAGVLFLSAFLLAFAGELRLGQRIVLALIMMISVGTHTSLFPIAALYAASVVVLRLAGRHGYVPLSTRSFLAWLLVPIIAAGFWTATQNQKMGLGFRLSPSKNAYLLGRLFGNGLAHDFLLENCPKRPFISCRYLSNLPKNENLFLFGHPLLDELRGHDDEVEAIVYGTILAYPRKFVVSSVRQTLLQLAALRTGGDMRLYIVFDWNFYDIQRALPGDFRAFWISRQSRDLLYPLTDAVAPVHTIIFWLSVASCVLFAWTGRFARVNKFFVSAIVFLVINAAVCGALAGVYDRYQSRVAWIMPLCLTAYICCMTGEWKRGVARLGPTSR
jgi:hypothetical protein